VPRSLRFSERETRAAAFHAVRAPCPRDGGHILKALAMGACALILLVLPSAAQSQSDASLGAQLTRHLSTMKKDRQVLRFIQNHRWLLSDPRFEATARRQVRLHTASLAATQRKAKAARFAIARRAKVRRLAAVKAATPAAAICRVFGNDCREALAVSRCESGLQTTAQNGQYLGLFQMGTTARRLYGHGASALEQAQAAHRYFLDSGRDWGPWSCKPWS